MNTEEALFNTFNEIVLLSELYEQLTQDQIIATIETVVSWFSELPPDVLSRYKEFLKSEIERENARGAIARANVLEDLTSTFDND